MGRPQTLSKVLLKLPLRCLPKLLGMGKVTISIPALQFHLALKRCISAEAGQGQKLMTLGAT